MYPQVKICLTDIERRKYFPHFKLEIENRNRVKITIRLEIESCTKKNIFII